jgi:hypothetical protein
VNKTTFVRKDSIGHDGPPLDEVHASIARVVEYAKMLGLHGVMIMSPRCPTCGHLHAFSMQTDIMANIDAEGTEVAALLRYYADMATAMRPELIEPEATN